MNEAARGNTYTTSLSANVQDHDLHNTLVEIMAITVLLIADRFSKKVKRFILQSLATVLANQENFQRRIQ